MSDSASASATVPATAPRAHGDQRLALAALFFGGVVIGFSGVFVRWSETGPVATGFYRMAGAGLVLLLLPFLVPASRPLLSRKISRSDRLWLIAAGLLFAADISVWHPALLLTTVSNATFIGNVSTIFVALGAWLIFKRRIGGVFMMGMAVTIAGAAMLMGVSLATGSDRLFGDALAMFAAIFYGGYYLVVAHLRARLTTLTVMTWTSIAAGLALLPVAIIKGEALLPTTLMGVGPLAGMALLVHLAGQGAIAYAFAHLSPQFAGLGTFLQPVASAVFAWILLGEKLGPFEIAGSFVILLGIWIAHRGSRRDEAVEQAAKPRGQGP
jgi:drug/metabolite transporter (DMT)-like permease